MKTHSTPGSQPHTPGTTRQYQYTGPTKQAQSRLRPPQDAMQLCIRTIDNFHGALYKYAIQGD